MFGRKKKEVDLGADTVAATASDEPKTAATAAKKREKAAANPYIEHQRNQDDRYMNLAKAKHNWQVAFCMQSALLSISIAFNGYALLKPKFQPYLMAMDQIGHVVVVGPVDAANPVDSKRVVRGQTIEWIERSRAIVGDLTAAKANVEWVYARVGANSAAKAKLDEYYKQREPYKTAASSSATATVTLALQTGNSYELEWTEEWRSLQGDVLRKERWKARVTFAIEAQNDEARIRRNPVGYFVTDFSWSKQNGV